MIKIKRIMVICIGVMLFSLTTTTNVLAEAVSMKNQETTRSLGVINVRAGKKEWVYKTINGKIYRRLYDGANKKWLTDWILC